jgi:CubicO group peptidase (beta-lactamase class C family)
MPRFLLFLAVSLTLVAATASAGPTPAESVDALMRDYAGDVPGASVLVARDGTPVLERSYGLANLEQSTPADSITNYRLASVTKQFTAAAIMLLVEDGRVGLDDSIRQWLPSLPSVGDAVTLRHLLVHGSGLIDYEDVMPQDFVGQLHDADVLEILETQQHTYFTPGTAYRYSNSGYALLALVVEKASNLTFPQFLQKRIFEPLGMTGTLAFVEGDVAIGHRAFGYSATGEGWERSDQSPTSAVLGDGGVYSSIHDLAKWDAALYGSRLLSDRSRALMFSPQVATDDPDVRYGFGWRISGDSVWHSGETTGFRNVIVRFPKQRLTVVILSNRDAPEPHATAMAIARLFLEQNR